MPPRSQRSGILAFVLLLFFASGFAALLYQTIWQRLLGFFSGVDVYSVTITVAAFMGGLGCGSLAGGQLADRLSANRRLLAFAGAEGTIALFALGSKWLYYDLLYVRWHALGESPVVLALVLFVSLLVPTFCMGVTLPLLARTFTARIEVASTVIGYLYGVNTLGAAIGALVTPWVLLRQYGFPEILQIGALLNGACMIGGLMVWWWARGSAETPAPSSAPVVPKNDAVFPVRVWMFLYALSGFIALSLEIVWFRLLGVLQKSTSFTFPTLLAVYLGGLAIGIIAGAPLARRVRRPGFVFLALQSGITLYTALALTLLVHYVDKHRLLVSLWLYLGSYEPVNVGELLNAINAWSKGVPLASAAKDEVRSVIYLYLAIPAALIGPSTILMGISFPVLQRLVQNNPVLLGRRVGWLQTLNIAGSMVGAVLAGWLLLGWFGSAGTLRFLVLLGGIFLCLATWRTSARRSLRLAATAVALLLVTVVARTVPGQHKLWARLHGATRDYVIAREDASGLAILKGPFEKLNQGTEIGVFANGIGQSWLPYGGVHTQIGMLGALVHPQPEHVAVIGLGSGDTVYALAASPHTKELTCIEIVAPAFDNLKDLAARTGYNALQHLLSDGRIRWLFTDGRAQLLRGGQLFDVIEADALRPNSAYSGNLYSTEYFRALRSALKPDGLAVSWVPTDRVLVSFLKSFPHTIVVNGVAVGGQQPFSVDPEAIARRLRDPFTSAHYARISSDVHQLAASLLSGEYQRFSANTLDLTKQDENSDLFPKDEYMVPQGKE